MALAALLFGALLVAAIYGVGGRYGKATGLAAAVLTAGSFVFVAQPVQSALDVPATAFLAAAVVAATGTKPLDPVLAGLAAASATAIRPSFAPLAIPLAVFLLFRPERAWPERMAAASRFAVIAAAGALIAGPPDVRVGLDQLGRNAAWLAVLVAPLVLPGLLTWMICAMVVLAAALNLLVPATPLALVLAAATLRGAWQRSLFRRRHAAAAAR